MAAEKEQDMREVGITLNAWEYRCKWLGEDEKTARARAFEIGVAEGAPGVVNGSRGGAAR